MTKHHGHPKQTIEAPPGVAEMPKAVLLPRQRVGRLDTVANWRRELGRLYRKMRSGELPADLGTKLAYVAQVAAKLVQIEQELAEARRIALALEQHRTPAAQIEGPAPDAGPATPVELLPADSTEAQP